MIRSIPREWYDYCKNVPMHMEIVSQPLICTANYVSRHTLRLEFNDFKPGYMRWMLPSPSAFLIRSIYIGGISTSLKHGECRLEIGNKLYLDKLPAWWFGLKQKGYRLNNDLMIAPMVCFRFQIQWNLPNDLGNDLSGEYIDERKIEVVFDGDLLRPT
jgi:hypothetical protein